MTPSDVLFCYRGTLGQCHFYSLQHYHFQNNNHLLIFIALFPTRYFLSKFFDFFDSFFFVARKKFSHLSTLHVVHHGGLPIAVWFGPKFVGKFMDVIAIVIIDDVFLIIIINLTKILILILTLSLILVQI